MPIADAAPDRPESPPLGRIRIEQPDARGVERDDVALAHLLGDELGHGLEPVDGDGDAAAEGLRGDVDPLAPPMGALTLDGEVQQVLVGESLDDEAVAELAARHDAPGRRRRDDGAVGRAVEALVDTHVHHELRRDDVEDLAALVAEQVHEPAALRAGAKRFGHRIGDLVARQVVG